MRLHSGACVRPLNITVRWRISTMPWTVKMSLWPLLLSSVAEVFFVALDPGRASMPCDDHNLRKRECGV